MDEWGQMKNVVSSLLARQVGGKGIQRPMKSSENLVTAKERASDGNLEQTLPSHCVGALRGHAENYLSMILVGHEILQRWKKRILHLPLRIPEFGGQEQRFLAVPTTLHHLGIG